MESMVKQVKRVLTSSAQNNILSYDDFEFFVMEAQMLVNKLPIEYKNILYKDNMNEDIVSPLTPEIVIKGYEVPCINILPQLRQDDDWETGDELLAHDQAQILQRYKKLSKIRVNLSTLYREEFVANLLSQAADRKGRYQKVSHLMLKVGDIVSIKTDMSKPIHYPLAVVVQVEYNDIGQVVSAQLRKSNGEIVRRHADHIIFISEGTTSQIPETNSESKSLDGNVSNSPVKTRPVRAAAEQCKKLNKTLLNHL